MEEVITQDQVAKEGPPQASSFQTPQKQSNTGSKWMIIFISLLILGGAGIFFFTKSSSEAVPTPTPSFGVVPIDTEIVDSTPSPTPAPVDKEKVVIEIQNGTGIPGEAKLLQDKLKTLGYSDITAGNATTTDNTETTVTFSKTLSTTVQNELKKELEAFYKTVNVKTVSTQKSDVIIITGLRGTQTTKPVSTATPKASSTASPTASPVSTSY